MRVLSTLHSPVKALGKRYSSKGWIPKEYGNGIGLNGINTEWLLGS